MSGCLGAHHSTAVSRGLLRLRRPTLSRAGATPAMPAASLVTVPDAGRCPDLGISAADSVVAGTGTGVADKSRRACPPAEASGLRATFLLVNLAGHQEFVDLDAFVAARKALPASGRSEQHDVLAGAEVEKADLAQDPPAALPTQRPGAGSIRLRGVSPPRPEWSTRSTGSAALPRG
jgi:hypothetical protein